MTIDLISPDISDTEKLKMARMGDCKCLTPIPNKRPEFNNN